MHAKKVTLVVLIALLATTFLPVVSAEAVEFEQVNVAIESQNEDMYSSINNLADPTAHNRDTWAIEPQGIFIGGVTPESKFRYTNHTGTDSNWGFRLKQSVTFDSGQIMDGVSSFIVRSPWAITSSDPSVSGLFMNIEEVATGSIVYASRNHIVADERAYFPVEMMIFPGVEYLFTFHLNTGFAGSSPYFWISPNDVASDGHMAMDIRRVSTATWTTIEADSGISFDMRKGAGGGIAGVDIQLAENEWVNFIRPTHTFTGHAHQTLIIPLVSTETAPVDVYVYAQQPTGFGWDEMVLVWSRLGQTYEGNIIASSPSTFNNADHVAYSVFLKARANCEISFVLTTDRDGWESWQNRFTHADSLYSPGPFHTIGPPSARQIAQYGNPILATLTPSTSAYQGPGYIEDWLELDRRIMEAFTFSERLGIAILDVALAPIAPWYQLYTGESLSQAVYFAIIDDIIPAVGALVQNGVDRAIDFLHDIGEFIIGVGEAIWDVVKIAISVLLKAFEMAFSFIAFLLIQMIFFWIPFQIVRLGEMLVSSAQGDNARAGRIAEKQRAGGNR